MITKTEMMDIKYAGNDGVLWINNDIVKFSVWDHHNQKLGLKTGDAIGKRVNVNGDAFEIKDCQPAVGWAVGTRWEVTCKRVLVAANLKLADDFEDDDE